MKRIVENGMIFDDGVTVHPLISDGRAEAQACRQMAIHLRGRFDAEQLLDRAADHLRSPHAIKP